jgi:hypothetical protein
MKPTTYRASFKPDFFSVRLDNSILFSQYQSYSQNGGQYQNPSLGELTTISLNELMENHRFTAGFQIPLDLSASAYFLEYQNFTRLVDWGLLFMHESNKLINTEGYNFKSTLDMIQADISYPFSRVRSLKFHTNLRDDQMIPRATDTISLHYLDQFYPAQFWSLSRLEYIFDNTISPTENIRFGTRYKAYVEYMYELNNGKTSCYNIGFDYRTYQKLYKNMIWATRVAYAHSDGSSEVQYQLGGVDNWLGAQQSPLTLPSSNPGFMALETNLRGYYQMSRIGNNFAVLNSEIRLPVLTTFIRRPIQSATLKNLQFVTFLDAGGAWNGFLPDASATSVSYGYPTPNSFSSPPNNVILKVTVPYGDGLALGYGAGFRTSLLGYFLRLDAAWNIEGTSTKPTIYFSMGTDF